MLEFGAAGFCATTQQARKTAWEASTEGEEKKKRVGKKQKSQVERSCRRRKEIKRKQLFFPSQHNSKNHPLQKTPKPPNKKTLHNHGAPLSQEPHLEAGMRDALRGHVRRREGRRFGPVPAAVPGRGRPVCGLCRRIERGIRRGQRRSLRRLARPEPRRALLCLPGAECRVRRVVCCRGCSCCR